MAYWQDRMQAAQQALLDKSRREIDRKMKEFNR